MVSAQSQFEALGNKESFNASVRHVKATVGLAERIAGGQNAADALDELLEAKLVAPEQVPAFVHMLLVSKFSYYSASKNLMSVAAELEPIGETVRAWDAVDLVVVYHHPDVGVLVINPKDSAQLAKIDRLNKYELLSVYAGCFDKPADPSLAKKACQAVVALFEGSKAKADPAFLKGPCRYKAAKKAAKPEASEPKVAKAPKASAKKAPGRKAKASVEAAPAAPVAPAKALPPPSPKPGARMTPMYAVPVTNELFHNGNVEAWKRIIESYKTKHPDLEVLVYYDGERITNLNALFKWGKVKHGSVIQFAVAGENICDVAKLQRYLAQGASKMFEAFLRGPVNSVLPLF